MKHSTFTFFIFVALLTTLATTPLLQPLSAHAQLDDATKEQLEQELADIERQIQEYEQQLATTQGEKKTLTNTISKLKKEQEALRLQVKSTTLKITDLSKKIVKTQETINQTRKKSDRIRSQLAELLRLMNRKEQELLLESLAAEGGLAEASQNVQSYSKMFTVLGQLVDETKTLHNNLKKQEEAFEEQEDEARNLLAIKNAQQQELKEKLKTHDELLKETKGKEESYQQSLSDYKKRAAQIKSRIYETVGGGKQLNFEEALVLAEYVSAQTGIRPAFILSVITQESNLGKNVGTCNRQGDPPEKSWKVVMKPDRDQQPFVTITDELGRDPDITPVSCPMKDAKGKQVGWGGAMGPAQFIPSTWMGYRTKVTNITGKPADPWDIRDAMLASAIKLRADGADGTYNGEWKAAMKYFAGSVNLKFRFYGDNIMDRAKKYEDDIETIKKSQG